jgi:hypothetical protein
LLGNEGAKKLVQETSSAKQVIKYSLETSSAKQVKNRKKRFLVVGERSFPNKSAFEFRFISNPIFPVNTCKLQVVATIINFYSLRSSELC